MLKKLLNSKIIVFFIFIVLMFFNCNTNFAQNIKKKTYFLPQGKTILLNQNISNHNIKWIAIDEHVASVDKDGFVFGKSIGSALILAIDMTSLNEILLFVINVTNPEPIKFLYVNPTRDSVNSNFLICAITNKNAQKIKLKIEGKNFIKEFLLNNPKTENETLVWEHIFKPEIIGNYSVTAYSSNKKDDWQTCSQGLSEFNVIANNKINNEPNLLTKSVSEKGIVFITSCEGFAYKYYYDCASMPTIGYGKLISFEEIFYNNLTKREAFALFLNNTIKNYEDYLNNYFINQKILFNQQQFDALVSFAYNLGKNVFQNNAEFKEIFLDCCTSKKLIGKVNSNNGLKLRKNCRPDSKVLKILKNNTQVEVLDPIKYNENWYHVKLQSGEKGYCSAEFLITEYVADGRDLNWINKEKFARLLSAYHHVKRQCCAELLARRFQELDIFFDGKYSKCCNAKDYLKRNFCYKIPECYLQKIK